MFLNIVDTSNVLYAGASNENVVIVRGCRESDGIYQDNSAPILGVKVLMEQINKMDKGGFVTMPVFDKTPTIKRKMYADTFGDEYGYKGNRTHKVKDSVMHAMREYSSWILRDVGFPVQEVDDYEADDVIYSLCKYYKDDFEHIYIYTLDSDLFFLVDDNISIVTRGSNKMWGRIIDKANYETSVKANEYVPYNVVHLKKLCESDTSDNIPGVGWDWGRVLDEIIGPDNLHKLGDLDLCRDYIKKAIVANPTMPGSSKLLQTFNILVPLEIPYELLNDAEPMIDYDKFEYYLKNWDQSLDRWNLEDRLLEYINQCNA